jgi:hypothetical protein
MSLEFGPNADQTDAWRNAARNHPKHVSYIRRTDRSVRASPGRRFRRQCRYE